jgi:hypothetical protein
MGMFQGKMPEYMGNRMGSMGSVGAFTGNTAKAAARKGSDVGAKMGNMAKHPMGRSNMKLKAPPA